MQFGAFKRTRQRLATPAGVELGAYLFIGSCLQLFGLQYTTVGRAAFIVQLTTVVVPLLDAALNRRVPRIYELGACALAFLQAPQPTAF